MSSGEKSIQETYAPQNACFGCGPSNPKGLRIRSFPSDGKIVAHWKAEVEHEAFPNILNGGIVGTLLDCHSNWTAAYHLMKKNSLDKPPCTVTADFHVKLLRPTPTREVELRIEAEVLESTTDRAKIFAQIIANGKVTATCEGNFVAVQPGHPAYHRW